MSYCGVESAFEGDLRKKGFRVTAGFGLVYRITPGTKKLFKGEIGVKIGHNESPGILRAVWWITYTEIW